MWETAQVSAVCLYQSCRADSKVFLHAQLANDENEHASGGWLAAVHRTQAKYGIPNWQAPFSNDRYERKRSLAFYRRKIVSPALQEAPHLPLPWAWICQKIETDFSAASFTFWIQIRLL